MRRIGFLIFDGVSLLDFAGPAEVFTRAHYETVLISPHGGPVTTAAGVTVSETLAPENAGDLDTVVITGSDDLPFREFDPVLLDAAALLTTRTHRVASVCTGSFILAELGLLDDHRATTHWRNAQDLARRYPQVRVQPDTLHIHDGRFFTSAGISAGIDLALSLVEGDRGAAVARDVARDMVMFMHRPGGQSQFAAASHTQQVTSPILRGVLDQVQAAPAAPHTVASLAADAAVSPRHLGRLFKEDLGVTPARWLEQFRLTTAQQLILEGYSVTDVAAASGFGSDGNLRRAFDRRLHTTPTEYRARFSSTFSDS
ncbi:GlxA family transcriptional regulator [Corynebacterium sputi]|uniref:GlxA family transcriptional regulator n=1 Tax=Corynebacterium sputi TaxID=489915 RepID=UPI000428AD17|nr:GlxA family transcriptional regulator [Corynebacterium sputi]